MSAVRLGDLEPDRAMPISSRTTATRCASSALLETDVGLVDRSNRGVIAITGPERLTLAAQPHHPAPAGPRPGRRAPSCSCSRRTGTSSTTRSLVDDGTTTWLDVEPGTAADLLDFLLKMRFLIRVEPVDVTADWALLSLVGPDARRALARLGVDGAGRAAGAARARAEVRQRRRRRRGRPPVYATVRAARAAVGPGGMPTGSTCWCPRATVADGGRDARACRRPGCGRSRRCGWPTGGRGWASRPTTGRCRPRSVGWLRPYTWTRAATAARRRWPGCTTWAGRRGGWCCCTSTASATDELPAPGTPVIAADGRDGRLRRYRGPPLRARPDRAGGASSGTCADDAPLRVGPSAAAIDPA